MQNEIKYSTCYSFQRNRSLGSDAIPASTCLAIVPYVPRPPSLENSEESFSTNDEERDANDLDLCPDEDDNVSTGSGFVYNELVLGELVSDRYVEKRLETERKKIQLLGETTTVSGQTWTVREDIPVDETINEEFVEVGLRSNTIEIDCLPKQIRCRDVIVGARNRRSPRLASPKKKSVPDRDEAKAIKCYFEALYPVNWKESIKRLNKAIILQSGKRSFTVSDNEYWVFIGVLLLAAVQKSGGIDGLMTSNKTDGIVTAVNASPYMSFTRFKYIKKIWMSQFEMDLGEAHREKNKWWRVGHLVDGFNNNRKVTVAASRVKVLDESMSAYRPQTSKTGNLHNISYIMRKPEPLGTELKTVASTTNNGPIIYAEVQEGKDAMKKKEFFSSHGATTACVLRLAKATKSCGQMEDPLLTNLYYGDSWFAFLKTAVAVTEELNSEFVGPVKTSHRHFPKGYLENTMKDWPPGSHLILETRVKENKYYAIGYKYNMKKVLCFISTKGGGHSLPGKPYEAKWLDDNGRITARQIPRPHILSEYFLQSNQIDKHNHARQSELAIEKNVVVECGYFRLFSTYLGITVTDAWKLYRSDLGKNCANKEISINSFANVLCKCLLLNDYSRKNDESKPRQTLRLLDETATRQELSFPTQISATSSDGTPISSLGSHSTNGLIHLGPGKVISSSFKAAHDTAFCMATNERVNCGRGSFSSTRRKRMRCNICKNNTTHQCSTCLLWLCNPAASTQRDCFHKHKLGKISDERNSHWLSLQGSDNLPC